MGRQPLDAENISKIFENLVVDCLAKNFKNIQNFKFYIKYFFGGSIFKKLGGKILENLLKKI